MAMSRMADQIGRVLGGRYRLITPIGNGASAQVFLADDVNLRRRVAVKVLHAALADDDAFLRRFRAEAHAAAAVSHPNLMAVYDWGEDDGPFLVLEYLGGGSLRSMLDRNARLSPSQALSIGLDAARGLDIAHRRGFVHRDIKPANLLFGEDGRLRIADFGLARALSEAALTEPGSVVGTARYASPEQARGEQVDGKADIYALGLVLIEAVTGRVPFSADTTIGTLMARVDTPVPVPDELGPLAPVLRQVGDPDPDRRPDAAQLGRMLMAAARELDRPAPLPLAGALDLTDTGLTITDPTLLPADARPDQGSPSGSDDETAVVTAMPAGADDTLAASPAAGATTTLPPFLAEWEDRAAATRTPADGGEGPHEPRGRRRRWPWLLLVLLVVAGAAAGGAYAWVETRVANGPVPNLVNRSEDDARAALASAQAEAELTWEVVADEAYSETVATGFVIGQDPDPNTVVDDGGTITFVVSLGMPPVPVPDLGDIPSEEEARARLAEAGLEVGEISRAPHEEVEPDHVLEWSQDGESRPTEAIKGTEIDLVLSSGPAPREVPTLSGSSFEEAQARLDREGLRAARDDQFHDSVPAGQVITSRPGAGATAARGDTVTVVVSRGPDLVTVPDVRGRTLEQAVAALEAAGLEAGQVYGPASGRPDSTDPEAGSRVRRGATVDIYLRR